eukprot:431107-Prorocentrum_minimum.AAC.2
MARKEFSLGTWSGRVHVVVALEDDHFGASARDLPPGGHRLLTQNDARALQLRVQLSVLLRKLARARRFGLRFAGDSGTPSEIGGCGWVGVWPQGGRWAVRRRGFGVREREGVIGGWRLCDRGSDAGWVWRGQVGGEPVVSIHPVKLGSKP